MTHSVPRTLRTLSLLLSLVLFSCGPKQIKVELDAEDRYALAKRLLDKGDCLKAIEEFQKVVFNFPGSDFVDDAEFGLGMAHYCVKDYALASTEFRRVLRDYPLSPYADDAQYMLGMCYYEQSMPSSLDQESTHKAIEAFQKLIEDFPEGDRAAEAQEKLRLCRDRLAKKDFDTGRLYLKLEYYKAALLSFTGVLTQYPDSRWAAEAQYAIAEVYEKQGDYEEARAAYHKVTVNYPTERLAQRAMKKIRELTEKARK